MPQDIFDKYVVKEAPKIDEFTPYESEEDDFSQYEVKPEKSIIEMLTTSILPDLNEKRIVPQEGTHPHIQTARIAEELGRGVYDDLIKPLGSIAGAGLAIAGGPLTRGALGIASKIPGVSKLGNLLGKEIIPGDAPNFIKKTVESLTPRGKTIAPIAEPIIGETPLVDEQIPIKPIDKLLTALDQSKPLNKEQAKILTAERKAKISQAKDVEGEGEDWFWKMKGKLSGKHTKLQTEPLKLDQSDINSLFSDIKYSQLDQFQKVNAGDGLKKILTGQIPQKNEIDILYKVFGEEKVSAIAAKLPQIYKGGNLVHELSAIARGMQTIDDLSFPFRQGKALINSRDWWKAWPDMIKAFGDENAYKGTMESILARPNYQIKILPDGTKEEPFFVRAGLKLTDLSDLSSREEALGSKLVEKYIPGARASNRAYTAFANKLRADHFDRMIKSAETAGFDVRGKDIGLSEKIANFVNNATGRGSLGRAEKYANALNDTLFSPRFQASRIAMLDPRKYLSITTPEGRFMMKKYWRSMLGLTSAWVGQLSLLEQGAGYDVEWNPTSFDFMKARKGDVTYDPGAGFQQYLVLASRLANNSYTSLSGKEREYGKGFGNKTQMDAVKEFVANKLAPVPKQAYDFLNRSEYRPFDAADRSIRMVSPMIMQDLSEIIQEDPSLLYLIGPAFVGEGIQVTGEEKNMFGEGQKEFNIPEKEGARVLKRR